MKYKSIFKLCLLTTFLSVATISCDDWTEMEIHDSQVNGFKEQNPQEYAAYTQNLRAYKATKHAVVKLGPIDLVPKNVCTPRIILITHRAHPHQPTHHIATTPLA